jgi:hypothetical protein
MNEQMKPPIGLRPRVAWIADRMLEISQAIQRYTAAFKPIPVSWIHEYNELAERLGGES